ncbi:MAG TPA: UDP-N-acetylglucosamine diphosphorylase [Candidatus Poseidoniaceae archaeon]|nr:MAG: UDP-N-acetylglucosamine diphosphorylase [Euryarchaeota archaeon TMED141]DAC07859.1 MAG TPA: UDP-N-acetylglucosamine diphosphorylase [Candidatus Poseidoniales archaeon]HII19507.1 UDP-N-acetylglucosamine diphosphorylase [Candidatus Poseidoniaceae archaeon]RPG76964.1 MAG: UDP-N-acetylglucosamine diphosphorylase [Euryarchaeota archaeon TMED141]DAC17609.1 MAG TPA: UDP-N-acetylglucosamine diphosphorylase [Candidatus Poseidoniales archaeon]|tara:strand:+ start:1663 stop:2343 length:681 start_codon:yes stop_codon:yes gene_type:complete
MAPRLPSAEDVFSDVDYGAGPRFGEGAVWALLDPKSKDGLRAQLSAAVLNAGGLRTTHADHYTVDEREGRVAIHADAVIEAGAHFIGPCFIEAGAVVRHAAYVRPWTWACRGSVIGHCTEVKHSVLLPGAKAPHFNYVGDSILGPGVNLGAGVKLSNLRHDGGEVHVWIDGERVPTGVRKFGAILGDGVQLGCNAVTNPGCVLVAGSTVDPNTTVSGVHLEARRHR